MHILRTPFVLLFFSSMMVWIVTCAPDYKNISDPNGRQAILDQANDFLTAGNCDQAINVLDPLIKSQYVNYDARMLYASAFACKGGMSFTTVLLAVKDTQGSDIWTPLVKSNFSTGPGDGHILNLGFASDTVRQAATPANSFNAADRTSDANVFMLFVHANILASVLAPLGAADSTTGHRTVAVNGAAASVSEQCNAEVSVATISDSLLYVDASANLGKFETTLTSACQVAFASGCPVNRDMSKCMGNPLFQLQGALLLTAIGTQWSN